MSVHASTRTFIHTSVRTEDRSPCPSSFGLLLCPGSFAPYAVPAPWVSAARLRSSRALAPQRVLAFFRRTGRPGGVGRAGLREEQNFRRLFLATFRRMPTASAEGLDRVGG